MDPYIYRLIRFVLLLLFLIPSIILFLLVFFFLFKTKQITFKHLHNHVILALLVCNFILITTELPITLVYSYQGRVVPQSDRFCSFWIPYNYSLYDIGLFLMAFGSIERYFLIFHERLVQRWQHIVHYPLLVLCFVYPLMFYSISVNAYPCENAYDYESYVCGGGCYQFQAIIGTADYIVNIVTPVFFILLGNIVLLFRVIKQKRAMKIAHTWRKNRLIYIQLVSISMLYSLVWVPFAILSLIRLFYDPLFLQDVMMLLLNYCLYICPLLSPLICLVGLPEVRKRLGERVGCMNFNNRNTNNRIGPAVLAITQGRQQHMMPRRKYDEHTF